MRQKPTLTNRICICTNLEMLREHGEFDDIDMQIVIREAQDMCFACLDDFADEDSNFSNWNGGKHDQFRKRYGFVSVHNDWVCPAMEKVAWSIDEDIRRIRNELCEQLQHEDTV